MPSVFENRRVWDGSYAWPELGDEWSAAWGTAEAQWRGSLFPRLSPLLPAESILEIAPGFGRWTQFLVQLAPRYTGVDLSASAIEACRARFASVPHAEFHVNDGSSLAAVPDGSVDLAFSFDSLVHVEADVIGGYLGELARTLSTDGVAFLHHSNLAACPPPGRIWQFAQATAERVKGARAGGLDHWRARTMSADRFVELAAKAGLVCIGQEVINWLSSRYLDCISLVTRPGSRWDRPHVRVHNPHFMAEAASVAAASAVYARNALPARAAVLDSSPGNGARRHFGPSATMISARAAGPWLVSVLGPWPRWRELAQAGRQRRG